MKDQIQYKMQLHIFKNQKLWDQDLKELIYNNTL